jgi:hypothetical protein
MVRRTTWVCTLGFMCAAAGVAAAGGGVALEFSAYPARPPSPSTVAPAAIFILILLTIVRSSPVVKR